MGLLTLFQGSALYQLVPIIAPIALGIVFLWILSVFGLSKRFIDLTGKHAEASAPAKQPSLASSTQAG